MNTAKASSKRAKKKAARPPKVPPSAAPEAAAAPPRWPMEERVVDPDAPYCGLSKEEFERLAFWRKTPRSPELDRTIDWMLANLDRMRAETIEPIDGSPMKLVPYDGESF